jgi:hypothetical protein
VRSVKAEYVQNMENSMTSQNRPKVGSINSDKPGVVFDVHLHNHSLYIRLDKNRELINQQIHFVMERLGGRNIPRAMIKSSQDAIKEAILSATNVITSKVEKLRAVIAEKNIRITERDSHPARVITCTSNTRNFTEYVDLVDLADQAIWLIEGLSTARLIKAQQADTHTSEIKIILSKTLSCINSQHSQILRLIKENGKVNEIAVAMPIDKTLAPEPLDHPLIGIAGVQKIDNTLVVVEHPAKALTQTGDKQ